MNIYRVLPDLRKKRHLKIWHKALRSQWSAEDLDWQRPRLLGRQQRDQLGRLLTPVLMGEQSALYSVSSLIPVLGHHSEVESQLYLTTWAVDEARHTELFARFYGRIEREPLSIRRFPSGYLFQSQIMSRDVAEWLAGVLVSEVIAKLLMEEFVRLDLDPVLSDIAHGILKDEARHLGFNHIYLEDRFSDLFGKGGDAGEAYSARLRQRMDRVLSHVPPIFDVLDRELADLGIDRHQLHEALTAEARQRLEKSIESGARVAAGQRAASQLAEAEALGR